MIEESLLERVKLAAGAIPSMVVMSRPAASAASIMQEAAGRPSTSTVHAPHCPVLHPSFVPVSPR